MTAVDTQEERAIRQWLSKPYPMSHACACIGRREPTDPVCGCAMAWVEKIDGHFFQIKEHRSPDGVTHSAEEIFAPEDPKRIIKFKIDNTIYEFSREVLDELMLVGNTNRLLAIVTLKEFTKADNQTARKLYDMIYKLKDEWRYSLRYSF